MHVYAFWCPLRLGKTCSIPFVFLVVLTWSRRLGVDREKLRSDLLSLLEGALKVDQWEIVQHQPELFARGGMIYERVMDKFGPLQDDMHCNIAGLPGKVRIAMIAIIDGGANGGCDDCSGDNCDEDDDAGDDGDDEDGDEDDDGGDDGDDDVGDNGDDDGGDVGDDEDDYGGEDRSGDGNNGGMMVMKMMMLVIVVFVMVMVVGMVFITHWTCSKCRYIILS